MKPLPEFNELCANDDLQPVMSYVYVTKEFIVATDAHVMGWAKTDDVFETDIIGGIANEGMLIHSEDWKKMTRAENIIWKKEGEVLKLIHRKKRDELIEVEYESEVAKFPNWRAVVPENESGMEISSISINPTLLMKIGKFFKPVGTKGGIKMKFNGVSSAVKCTPHYDTECESIEAIIMPLM